MSSERESAVHPPAERLEAWADGRLDAAAAAVVERHFARCAECRRLGEDLRAFGDPVGEGAESEMETEASLGRLRMRILAEDLAASEGELGTGGRDGAAILPFAERTAPPPPAPVSVQRRYPTWALAAGLLITAGLAWNRQLEVERLNSDLQAAYLPLANTAIVEVVPESAPLRTSPQQPAGLAGGVNVVVDPSPEVFPAGEWEATVENLDGVRKLAIGGLRPIAGQLRFLLQPKSLPPGRYRLRLEHDGKDWPESFILELHDG